ncbi:hypothetical protein LIG30_3001 [Burkholderia sp. lig30]|jgi:hypothetical protein|uniref:hypothetical protein n=1 Tax=Burkholderia sp. lig30 TaxID=1192124 RepID=UPI000460C46A|nr:hypothetical protein [Burkholderia sp. lig30]KDB07799.1 hypothetical protein LIG30_3001 [Burkholderia sp. lig30]
MLNTGGKLKPTAHLVCIVYDAHSGHIAHVHHEISLHKGPHATQAEAEAAALDQLKKRGKDASKFRVLHIKPDELSPLGRYKVDPQRRTLEQL